MDSTPSRPRRVDALALFILSVPLIFERALLIGRRAPTGADETLYLMQALDWLGRFTKLSRDAHRTWGVPAIISPIAAATNSVAAYRIAFAVLSIALCAVVYLVGRRFLDPIPAAFAAVMLGMAATPLFASIALLPDLPAALGVATAFLFYWSRVVRVPPGEPVSGMWPVGIAVGSVLYFNIAFAAFVAVTIGIDFLIFRRRDVFSRAALGAVVALGATVAPYFITIFVRYGDPTYTLRLGLRGVGATTPAGEPGYVVYSRWFFDSVRFFGPVWGVIALGGLGVVAYALIRGVPILRRDAAALALWLTVPTIATAFLFHAEARYMVPWLPAFFLALAVPAQAVLRVVPRLGGGRTVGLIALTGVLIVAATQFGLAQYKPASARVDGQVASYDFIHTTAGRLARRGVGPPCHIYTRYPREFELHTGCSTSRYGGRAEDKLIAEAEEQPTATYFVWWTGLVGDEAQQPSYLSEFFKKHATQLFSASGRGKLKIVYVYRYVPVG